MKRFLSGLLVLCAIGTANAQQGFNRISAGAEVALPLGNFGTAYGLGIGATGKVFYSITEQGEITGTLGYLRFGMKNTGDHISGNMGMVPIMFGYRHNFDGLYAEPQLGLTMLRSTVKMDDMGMGLSGMSGTHSQSKVSFGLGGGYVFGDWDLGARLQIIDNLNFIGIRIGYNFSL